MIEVEGLNVSYGSGVNANHVVRDVSFRVKRGETVGIVGESGCGKSTVLRSLVGLEGGWTGRISMDGRQMSPRRSRADLKVAQMVFQDPFGSLHPRHRIGTALSEPARSMGLPHDRDDVGAALDAIGLPRSFAVRFPHELSGGQRQRVAIARAMIVQPPILLLDEPTSALDVSVQAEVLNLLADRKEENQLTFVLVSHDLSVVSHMCDRILVMEQGQIVDELSPDEIAASRAKSTYAASLIEASFYGNIGRSDH